MYPALLGYILCLFLSDLSCSILFCFSVTSLLRIRVSANKGVKKATSYLVACRGVLEGVAWVAMATPVGTQNIKKEKKRKKERERKREKKKEGQCFFHCFKSNIY